MYGWMAALEDGAPTQPQLSFVPCRVVEWCVPCKLTREIACSSSLLEISGIGVSYLSASLSLQGYLVIDYLSFNQSCDSGGSDDAYN